METSVKVSDAGDVRVVIGADGHYGEFSIWLSPAQWLALQQLALGQAASDLQQAYAERHPKGV